MLEIGRRPVDKISGCATTFYQLGAQKINELYREAGCEINIKFLRVRRTRRNQNLGVLPKIWESGLVKQNIQDENKNNVINKTI